MQDSTSAWRRALLLSLSMALAVVSVGAQGRGAGANAGDVVRQVRTALAHGDVAGARRLAEAAASDPARQALSRGRRRYLRGQVRGGAHAASAGGIAAPLGDAALELGLARDQDRPPGRGPPTPRSDAGRALLCRSRRLSSPGSSRPRRAASSCSPTTPSCESRISRALTFTPRAATSSSSGTRTVTRSRATTRRSRSTPAGCRRSSASRARSRIEQPAASRKALAAAIAVAPDSPDVWLVTAEQKLDEEDAAAARDALDKLAAVTAGDDRGGRASRGRRVQGNGHRLDRAGHRARARDRSGVGARVSLGQRASRARLPVRRVRRRSRERPLSSTRTTPCPTSRWAWP